MAKRNFRKNQLPSHPLGINRLEERPPLRAAHFSELVPQIMARYGGVRKLGISRFQRVWKEVLQDVFGNSGTLSLYEDQLRLVAFRAKTLRVEVQGNILFQEVLFYQEQILRAFQQRLPDENIVKMKFVTK